VPLMDWKSNGGVRYHSAISKTLIHNTLQSRFPSHPMKSENMLLLNLKERMKKRVNFELVLLVWKKTKSGVEMQLG